MLCLSLEHQSAEDIDHARHIGSQCSKPPTIKKYNMYFTCHGVYRGTNKPTEKLRVTGTGTGATSVKVPWNKEPVRTFIQSRRPEWDRCDDQLLAPLAVVPVQENVFQVSAGTELAIITQGVHDEAVTNIVVLCEDGAALDARYLRE